MAPENGTYASWSFESTKGDHSGVPDFSVEHYEVCRGCALGKYTKLPFPASDNRSIGILDLIHTNVSGRMSLVSLFGYEYYVIFIDDYSRRN